MLKDVDLGRNIGVTAGSTSAPARTPPYPLNGATVVEMQIVCMESDGYANLQWSADGNNWRTLQQFALNQGANNLTPVTGITDGLLRVTFEPDIASNLVLRVTASLFVPDSISGSSPPVAPPL